MDKYKTIDNIKKQTKEELIKVVPSNVANNIIEFFKNND